MDDSSDTEIPSREEMLKRYMNNPEIKKYEKYITNIKSYLIDIGEKTIDDILKETITTFFELRQKLISFKLHDLINYQCYIIN